MFKYRFIYFFTLFYFLSINNSYAYLDPGTGSILLQILAGLFAGILAFFKKIKSFFKKIFKRKK